MLELYRRASKPRGDFNKVVKQLYWNHTLAVNFLHVFRTPFYKNTSGGLFLTVVKNFFYKISRDIFRTLSNFKIASVKTRPVAFENYRSIKTHVNSFLIRREKVLTLTEKNSIWKPFLFIKQTVTWKKVRLFHSVC